MGVRPGSSGQLGRPQRINTVISLYRSRCSSTDTNDRRLRPVHRPGRLRLEQRAALREGRRRGVTDNRSASARHGYRLTTLDSVSDTRWGGTVGAGLEFGFAPNWSAGVRIRPSVHGQPHTDTSSIVTPVGVLAQRSHPPGRRSWSRVRVNYRWGGPVVAKY